MNNEHFKVNSKPQSLVITDHVLGTHSSSDSQRSLIIPHITTAKQFIQLSKENWRRNGGEAGDERTAFFSQASRPFYTFHVLHIGVGQDSSSLSSNWTKLELNELETCPTLVY
jgi:hypothetical protein